MQRAIPLHVAQRIPEQWRDTSKSLLIDSEEQLTRKEWMDDEFYNDYRANIDTTALTYAVMHALAADIVPELSFKGLGAFNQVFCFEFPDGFRVAARIPKQHARSASVEAIVAIMTMARCMRNIPAPQVYAWNPDANNPVGAPYILVEWVEGLKSWEKWENLPPKDLSMMLSKLASHHVNFARPLSLSGYGSLYFAKDLPEDNAEVDLANMSTYRLGPMSRGPSCLAHRGIQNWPQTTPLSLRQFWNELWQHEMDWIETAYGSEASTVIATEKHPSPRIQETYTLGQLIDAAGNLKVLINKCFLPSLSHLYEPCLVSTDYAFRNIKIDPQSLEVTAFTDWDNVYIMPFLLCSRYPDDICWTNGAGERWHRNGAFSFLPLDEQPGEDQSDSDSDDSSDEEKKFFGSTSDSGKESDSEDDSESARHSPPPTPPSVPEYNSEDYDRPRRIKGTLLRQQYEQMLVQYDPRFGTEGFWQIREDPLKIQHLVTHGWIEWLVKRRWLRQRAEQFTKFEG